MWYMPILQEQKSAFVAFSETQMHPHQVAVDIGNG
jgi:hypothetical protein